MSYEATNPRDDDLTRYLNASQTLDTARSQVAALEQSAAVETFNNQMALLQRRLMQDPQAFRDIFMADGAIVEQGSAEQVFGAPQHARTREFLSQVER